MLETLQNNADWDCCKTPIFAGDLEDSKSTLGGTLCIFGSHTCVPVSWKRVRNKLQFYTVQQNQKSSLLDAGLRLDGIPALDFIGSDCRSSWKHESES